MKKKYKNIKVIKGQYKGCYGELMGKDRIGDTYRTIILFNLSCYSVPLKEDEFQILGEE